MILTFKSSCPKCGAAGKLKSEATAGHGGAWIVKPAKCYKCGHKASGFVAK